MLEVKTPQEVLELIQKEFKPLGLTEHVPLAAALGRVLAEPITAQEYVPDFDRSTVDGYACRASDTFGCSDVPRQGDPPRRAGADSPGRRSAGGHRKNKRARGAPGEGRSDLHRG